MQDDTFICYACLPSFKMQVIYASLTCYASYVYVYMQAQHVMQVMCMMLCKLCACCYASSYASYVYDVMQVMCKMLCKLCVCWCASYVYDITQVMCMMLCKLTCNMLCKFTPLRYMQVHLCITYEYLCKLPLYMTYVCSCKLGYLAMLVGLILWCKWTPFNPC